MWLAPRPGGQIVALLGRSASRLTAEVASERACVFIQPGTIMKAGIETVDGPTKGERP